MVDWNDEVVLKRLVELVNDPNKYTQTEIGVILYTEYPEIFWEGIPNRNQVKHGIIRAYETLPHLEQRPITDIMPYWSKYRDEIEGKVIVGKSNILLDKILNQKRLQILVLSDIHIPFQDEEKLQKAIDIGRNSDLVVLCGDISDMYSQSRFRKRVSIPLEVELDGLVRFLEFIAQTFPATYIVPGNHDQRVTRKIQSIVAPELLFLIKEREPLRLISRAFTNVFYHDNWWLKINDAIFAHSERSTGTEVRPAAQLSEYFLVKGWGKRYALGDIRVVVQAHTHSISAAYREDLKLFESGCLAQLMEYATDSDANMRTPKNGFVIVTQYEGKSDFNQSREYLL